jgi:protein gp37
MCDVFEDDATVDREREKLWPLIRATPALDWMILTKRAARIRAKLPRDWGDGYPNAWLGVSVETDAFRWRVDYLRRVPAAVRFVFYEPAVGPLHLDPAGLDWVVVGGESGPNFRPMEMRWARSLIAGCQESGVACFVKQDSARQQGERGRFTEAEWAIKQYPRSREVQLSLSQILESAPL